MDLRHSDAGLEVRLRATGVARYVGALFLTAWLSAWAVGEGMAAWFLFRGARTLLTGLTSQPGRETVHFGALLAGGLFLLLWLSLWTVGGLAAGYQALRLLFGSDRFCPRHDGLEVEYSCGLFRSRRKFPRDEIQRFYRRRTGDALWVQTTRGAKELSQLGTADDRARLEHALNTEFGVSPGASSQGVLPARWCEVLTPEGEPALVKPPAVRRKQAIATWIICALLGAVTCGATSAALEQPAVWALGAIAAGITALVAWGALWLTFGREEWLLERGRFVLQRRFCEKRTRRFEAVALELVEDHSGEDGTSYVLRGVAENAPPSSRSYSPAKYRRVIESRSEDPTEPRQFGAWLAERCQIPFADLTTAEARALDLAGLKQQLAASGRFGAAVLKIVERVAPSPRNPRDAGS